MKVQATFFFPPNYKTIPFECRRNSDRLVSQKFSNITDIKTNTKSVPLNAPQYNLGLVGNHGNRDL